VENGSCVRTLDIMDAGVVFPDQAIGIGAFSPGRMKRRRHNYSPALCHFD